MDTGDEDDISDIILLCNTSKCDSQRLVDTLQSWSRSVQKTCLSTVYSTNYDTTEVLFRCRFMARAPDLLALLLVACDTNTVVELTPELIKHTIISASIINGVDHATGNLTGRTLKRAKVSLSSGINLKNITSENGRILQRDNWDTILAHCMTEMSERLSTYTNVRSGGADTIRTDIIKLAGIGKSWNSITGILPVGHLSSLCGNRPPIKFVYNSGTKKTPGGFLISGTRQTWIQLRQDLPIFAAKMGVPHKITKQWVLILDHFDKAYTNPNVWNDAFAVETTTSGPRYSGWLASLIESLGDRRIGTSVAKINIRLPYGAESWSAAWLVSGISSLTIRKSSDQIVLGSVCSTTLYRVPLRHAVFVNSIISSCQRFASWLSQSYITKIIRGLIVTFIILYIVHVMSEMVYIDMRTTMDIWEEARQSNRSVYSTSSKMISRIFREIGMNIGSNIVQAMTTRHSAYDQAATCPAPTLY